MVALGADGCGEVATTGSAGGDLGERVTEVVARRPAEVVAGAGVVVDALDGGEHAPAEAVVEVCVLGDVAGDDGGCVGPELLEVFTREGRGRADDVAAEADGGRAVEGELVRGDGVFEVDAPVEQLVGLQVGVVVGGADVVAVVGFGEEARGAQDQDGQAVVAVDELAEVLGRGLRYAVDVARDRVRRPR